MTDLYHPKNTQGLSPGGGLVWHRPDFERPEQLRIFIDITKGEVYNIGKMICGQIR